MGRIQLTKVNMTVFSDTLKRGKFLVQLINFQFYCNHFHSLNYLMMIITKIIVNVTTIMWALPVTTDRKILANRPGILVHDKQEETCLIIDIAITDD